MRPLYLLFFIYVFFEVAMLVTVKVKLSKFLFFSKKNVNEE